MRRKIPVTLTPEEVEKIIHQPDKRVPTGLRNKALLSFIWDSGARVSDVVNLKTGNVKVSKREAVVIKGKGGIDRNLSFSDYTAELFERYKKIRPKSEYFFCTLKGKKLSRLYLYNMVRRYALRAGITKKIGLHTLRHSFALDYYQKSGHDLIRLQKILGHRSIGTTQLYCYMDSSDVINGLKNYYGRRKNGSKDNVDERIRQLEEEIRKIKADV